MSEPEPVSCDAVPDSTSLASGFSAISATPGPVSIQAWPPARILSHSVAEQGQINQVGALQPYSVDD
eukprot:SAG31_NODE_2583_length_5435_cov_55.000000_2_plen_67_part_00